MSVLLDRIAAHPTIYGLIQGLAGRAAIMRHMQPWFDEVSGRVVDVGGGTGRIAEQLSQDVRYVCVDLEWPKLQAVMTRSSHATGVRADGTALPFRNNALDAALLLGVTHHLSLDAMRHVLNEIARVLLPSAHLILLDAVWAPRRPVSRALWACDRGSYPRTASALEAALRVSFQIENAVAFAVLHEYCAFRCRKRQWM